MAITLDSLPLEIVALIAEPLAHDRPALLNFAVTSSRYQAASEALLWRENRDHQNAPRPVGCSDLLMEDEEQFFAALRQQAHSLQTITYRPRIPELLDSFSGRQSFAEFTELTHFTINAQLGHSDLLESSLLGTAPRLESLTVDQEEHRLHGQSAAANEQPAPNRSIIQLAKRALASDTLKELRLDVSSRRSIEEFSSRAVKSAVDASRRLLSSKQITLLIVFQVHRRWGLVPPYLYGEEEPSQRVIYDSRTGEWDNSDGDSDFNAVDQLDTALWNGEHSEDEEE
ncbi:hypothetical protein Slin15195_G056470 [Septoria linicola]|uniref:Uncharacterized protein n=1 Tax=Septoria linicola TaxID=215465 RepID=A0A9Q9ASD6_9PEZI|nr:hypothetical protein Slin14017_G072350 [Septoria linicola]USW52328.1 hypothetical protein Slin15195_G056470 [Septoria linicola]